MWLKEFLSKNFTERFRSLPYDKVCPFFEGMAAVQKGGKRWFIDETWKDIVPCIYDYVEDFCEWRAAIKKGGKRWFIDKTWKEVVPCIYQEICSFWEWRAAVKKDGKRWFINETWKEVIKPQFDSVKNFSHTVKDEGKFKNGKIIVKKQNKYYILDIDWKVLIPDSQVWLTKLVLKRIKLDLFNTLSSKK